MPIRAPWTWMGGTPHLGMPRSASGTMAMYIPILPSAAGSLPASNPVREGHWTPWTAASRAHRRLLRPTPSGHGFGAAGANVTTGVAL